MRIVSIALTVSVALSACSSSPGGNVITGSASRPLELSSALSTPPLDRSNASVALDRIIFDTFGRGPRISLAEIDDTTIAQLFDAISPIDAPSYQHIDDALWLSKDDIVLGYVDPQGDAWAYPIRLLNQHEIVNDELGGLPVVITYCPLCGSGVVYERTLNTQTLTFSNTSALFENDMVMVDRETGSYWWQVRGEALVGELTGAQLRVVPSRMSMLADWRDAHPDSAVISPDPGRIYAADAFASYGETLDSGRTPFPVSTGVLDDDRLRSSALVVVVEINGSSRAWPTQPSRVMSDEVGGVLLSLTFDGTGAVVVDDAGTPVASRTMLWFAAVSAFPSIELDG